MSEALAKEKINTLLTIFSSGKFDEALALSIKLTKKYPEEAILFNIQGACYAGLENYKDAIESYELAIALSPNYAKAFYNLAGTFHEMGDLKASLNSYKSALKIEPKNEAFLNNLGNLYLDLKEHNKAIECYKKATKIKPDYIEAHYSYGNTLQDQGNLKEAIKCYEKVLQLNPSIFGLHNNLGNIYRVIGNHEKAIKRYKEALNINPEFAEALFNLGITYSEIGDHDNAIESYKLAINIKSDYVEAHNNLGLAFKEIGQLEKAVSYFEKSLQFRPNYVEAINNYGVALREIGKLEEALEAHKQALKINPDSFEDLNNLGVVNMEMGNFDEALKNYEEAISLNPDYIQALNNLGSVQKDLGKLDSAIISFEKALLIEPEYVEALNNLGIVYKELGDFESAIKSYEKAISIDSDYVFALNNLGVVLNDCGDFESSSYYLEKAIKLKPDYFEALSNYGNLMFDMGNLDMALEHYQKAFKFNPNFEKIIGDIIHTQMHLCSWNDFFKHVDRLEKNIQKGIHSIGIFALLGLIDSPLLQSKAAEILVKEKYPKNNTLPKLDFYPRHKKIRIGYFSPDFREHPVSDLIVELLEIHNRNEFEIHAFSCGRDTQDKMNLRIKAGVDHFHDVHMKPDQEIAMLARSLEIDIAIDLGGFTQGSRTGVFSMSAAPIQTCYLGYPGTMGSDYIDYLICDHIVIPDDKQNYYLENLVYMPNSYMVNDSQIKPSDKTFTRKDLNLPAKGFVFCCFNSIYKITPEVFGGWMRILKAVNDSVLWLTKSNKTAIENLKQEAVKLGIDENRLIFASRLELKEDHLKRIQSADLFLDTLPFNAHTTTSDALRV